MNEQPHHLGSIRHFALDLDGTLRCGDKLLPGVTRFISALRRLNLGFTLVTNNSACSAVETAAQVTRLGVTVLADQVYHSAAATREYLRETRPDVRRVLVIGGPGARDEWREMGYQVIEENTPHDPEPDAVIVGLEMGLTFDRLCHAAYWIKHGKPFFATHPDRFCPSDDRRWILDCGALCAGLQEGTGRRPDRVLGKPNPFMLHRLMDRHGLAPTQLAMVGDRLSTDIAAANAAGVFGVLVLTGDGEVEPDTHVPKPDLVVPTLHNLTDLLERAQRRRVQPTASCNGPGLYGQQPLECSA